MEYELVRGFRQRIALFAIGGPHHLARLEWSDGYWRVLKRRQLGWELIVENADGRAVAWYSGRRWRAGGTIFLATGPQLDLVKRAVGGWTLRTVGRQEPMLQMHGLAAPLRVELISFPVCLADVHIAVLIACAIPLIDQLLIPRPLPR
jgi:hypothetical protein